MTPFDASGEPPSLATLALLAQQVTRRIEEPNLLPSAWQLFLFSAYKDWPPRTLTWEQIRAEVNALHAVQPMSVGVTKALRRALVLYHPDRNQEAEHGQEWAQSAEELAKLATVLLEHYRRRVSAAEGTAEGAGEAAEGSRDRSRNRKK